jgi:hypothetical protein
VAPDAAHVAFEWNVVNNLHSGIDLPAASIRLCVASAGRVLGIDLGALVGESPLAPSSAHDRLVNPDQC